MLTPRRARRIHRIRAKVQGTAVRPRLAVLRTSRHFRAQAIDDQAGRTLAWASDELLKTEPAATGTIRAAQVGQLFAERAKQAGIARVVFDRRGYRYHGRVKAFADALRAAGIAC
ncbi:50S ribosomal protein L18 [Candidatus Berkelbacteria bacterium]|nr:50S ribosomal protein L18 [Candidatus Berkelbacteria bacterium]